MTKSKQKPFQPGKGYTEADWDAVLDTPEATDKQIAKARPFAEVFPDMAANAKRSRGRPPVETPKESVTLRVDADILEAFRATGKGWQTRMNDWLRLGMTFGQGKDAPWSTLVLKSLSQCSNIGGGFAPDLTKEIAIILQSPLRAASDNPAPIADPVPARSRRAPSS